MITQLSTVKDRLAIAQESTASDALLNSAIEAVTALFCTRCRRSFARAAGTRFEFSADRMEVPLPSYPVELITQFELKSTEAGGWAVLTQPDFILREQCVLCLLTRLGKPEQLVRVTYTGGYVMPGSTLQAGQTMLPADIENAAVEQVATWYLHRDKAGLVRNWPSGGIYQQFITTPLLPATEEALKRYERWNNV